MKWTAASAVVAYSSKFMLGNLSGYLLSHCARHVPVHQADVIEIDAVKHKQANIGVLESSFLQDN